MEKITNFFFDFLKMTCLRNSKKRPGSLFFRFTLHASRFTILVAIISCTTQDPLPTPIGGAGEANPTLKTNAVALKNFQDMRFGMFVHWGPISLKGTEIGWSRGREVPISTYDSLYLQFNPVNFNANDWIGIAKEAGMKYFVITSKHHDGFALWPSEFTDFDIASTPYKKDVLKEMELACEQQGILFGTYHSVLDWHHPDYTTRYGGDPRPVDSTTMVRYKKYLFNQVKELVQNYHTNILWFDGQWEGSWTHKDGMELYKFIRDMRDDILINNRVDKGFKGMAGMTDSVAKYAGDYGTPEQRIGGFNRDYPWESCITVGDQWAWKPNEKLKSVDNIVHTLIKTVGGDGNLLLNVGPMPDGRIEPRQVDLLKGVGKWLTVNGEGVYGTRGGPFLPGDKMASTHKGQFVYLHVMDKTIKEIRLPLPQGVKATRVSILGGKSVSYDNREKELLIRVPENISDSPAYVVKIRLNRNAADIQPIEIK
jgi:alpha-L-fucosidase